MARTPMVTRTIQTTKVTVLCLNIQEEKPFTQEVTLSRTYKDEKAVMKEVSKLVDNDNVKAVHIVSTEVTQAIYGMPEQQFIELATIQPERKTKKENEN